MARRVGRPPTPTEKKIALGNPGKRKITGIVVALPGRREVPEPPRPLGHYGTQTWERLWTNGSWLSQAELDVALLVCEQVDERVALRSRVIAALAPVGGVVPPPGPNDWRDRLGLRHLDDAIQTGFSVLGFTPTDRARLLGAGAGDDHDPLEEYRRRKVERLNARAGARSS